ncbi:dTDP-4-dehydrorhamnose 3,5-epimerase [Desulfocurvibacter africanus]|uniref:dTDP-4-dehydrorhamnose 3,5-epimerase n=1 Tax=Desulfocurvibacter africanus subsp. africanus str. Walvis Bay TaxID=690850 RepID=F3YUF3_DESAF|nr:dTDP-4-dehydrorhamnose 3,5-epimerase [Desulfocurvibacter africanus]EGJ48835.1 dTDP-4-dehydrorhamnose 3,5-epimerase [Desulfocurvibacter africanus subsp. africanus str. Walvis Bay]
MEVERTDIEGVLLIKPNAFGDHRGFFLETFQAQRYGQAGIGLPFVQDNLSRSRQGILRGLHFQRTYPQGKLVSVTRGRVFDVAVDIRPASPTFGKWYGAVLDDENHHQLWVAPGLAHGFCVMSETADFTYKCTDYYHPEDEGCLRWNDPDIGIDWPVQSPTLSDKDAKAPSLRELFPQRFA